MLKYEPKTIELQELGIELLEKGFDGIECFINPENNRIIAHITEKNEVKKLGCSINYPTGNIDEDLELIELELVNEIKIYFAIDKYIEIITEDHKKNANF